MTKTFLFILAAFFFTQAAAQNQYLVLKKNNRTLRYFLLNGIIVFQAEDRQWIRGTITRISNDSFYLTKEVIRYYQIGSDTFHFSGFKYALKDVYALPTKKEQAIYDHDQVRVALGHEKFAWVKN